MSAAGSVLDRFDSLVDDVLPPRDASEAEAIATLGDDVVARLGRPDDDPEIAPTILVNPEIRAIGDDVEEGWEGCLSIPGLRGLVPRPRRIKVKARGVDGEPVSLTADGFHARVIQHENDHLDGGIRWNH